MKTSERVYVCSRGGSAVMWISSEARNPFDVDFTMSKGRAYKVGCAATGYRVGVFTGRYTKASAEFAIDGKRELIAAARITKSE